MNAFPMSAMFLVLTSTVFHAGWNLLARRERNEQTFLLRAVALVAVIGFVPAVLGFLLLPPWPAGVWQYALGTGLCSGVYFFALGRAYNAGDFTFVYPIARAVPVLLVGVSDAIRGQVPTAAGWFGMTLVALGCLIIPLHSFREINIRMYLNRTALWVIITAAGTTGYSIIDKYASDLIATTRQGFVPAIQYCYLFYGIAALFCFLMYKIFGRGDEDPAAVGWTKPLIAGLLTFLSYALVLWTFQIVAHAGYVVAFRQFSILIGVVIAVIWFRERGAAIRVIASCIMVAGMVLIKLFG